MKKGKNLNVWLVISMFLLLMVSTAAGGTIIVDDDGPADFNNIQAAINDANHGDTIIVAPGEYVINSPIDFNGKAIAVKSTEGPEKTIIHMQNPVGRWYSSVVIFKNGEGPESV